MRAQTGLQAARGNARFALDEAMAVLSHYAGPDQAVTATAAILGPDVEHPHWTGVWSTRSGHAPVWLVSAASADPRQALAEEEAVLLRKGEDLPVLAPMVRLSIGEAEGEAGEQTVGAYAWQVEDEGVKAHLSLYDPGEQRLWDGQAAYLSYRLPPAKRLRQMLSPTFVPGPDFPHWQADDPDFPHLETLGQLSLTRSFPAVDVTRLFSAYTVVSRFVLADTQEGGLRRDLTPLAHGQLAAAAYRDDWINEDLAAFLQSRLDPSETSAVTLRSPVSSSGFRYGLLPVIAEFTLVCGIAADAEESHKNADGTRNVIFNYYCFLDLWNPYTKALKMADTAEDILVVIEGLPACVDQRFRLPERLEIKLDCFRDLPAGHVQILTMPGSARGKGISYNGKSVMYGVNQIDIGDIQIAEQSDFRIEFLPTDITVRCMALAAGGADLLTMVMRNFQPFAIEYDGGNSLRKFVRTPGGSGRNGMNRTVMNQPGWSFAYHFKMRDEYNPVAPHLLRWLSEFDPRSPTHVLDIAAVGDKGGDDAYEVQAEPFPYYRSEIALTADFFTSTTNGFTYSNRNARFFESGLAQPPASIGVLRQLQVKGLGPYAVGQTWGGEINRIFDRYFFSTLPEKSEAWDGSGYLPNPRLRLWGGSAIDPVQTARSLLVEGGFNANSTSLAAWKAFLRSDTWRKWSIYEENNAGANDGRLLAEIDIPNGYANLSQSAAENWTLEAGELPFLGARRIELSTSRKPLDQQASLAHPAFIQGFVDLDEVQIDSLAHSIVVSLQRRGKPFFSLAELVNSGLLQNAIDATPSINDRQSERDGIIRYAPANFHQGTILERLGPHLFVRSDTFTIRAYGETINPVTSRVEGRAWCEAVVQRSPEPYSGLSSDTRRRFQIIAFRWLTPEEL